MEINNFFLDVYEFTTASSINYVDLVDDIYSIDIVNSYFSINGQRVPVTFSGIEDGQRMFCDPPVDFYNLGVLNYTVHAVNTNSGIEEKDYELLYGYDVDFYDDDVNWGIGKKVDVWVSASTSSYCPNTETDAYYFVTRDFGYKDLNMCINAVGYEDLSVFIYPQDKVFYYGQTYTVTVSGIKDYHLNELGLFSFSFTIEEKD